MVFKTELGDKYASDPNSGHVKVRHPDAAEDDWGFVCDDLPWDKHAALAACKAAGIE